MNMKLNCASMILMVIFYVLMHIAGSDGYKDEPVCDGGNVMSISSGMNDIVVSLNQTTRSLLSTRISVVFGKFGAFWSLFWSRKGTVVTLHINNNNNSVDNLLKRSDGYPVKLVVANHGVACFQRSENKHKFTFEDLEMAKLKNGNNPSFLRASSLGMINKFNLFKVTENDRFIISDIDGTITKSDFAGRVLPLLGLSKANQKGVLKFFQALHRNKYQIIYITARSYVREEFAKQYLFQTLGLPVGPILLSPVSFLPNIDSALNNPSEGKTLILKDLLTLFPVDHIVGAYGNRASDKEAYLNAKIDPKRIWIVDEGGIIVNGESGVPNEGMINYKQHLNKINDVYPPL